MRSSGRNRAAEQSNLAGGQGLPGGLTTVLS